MKNFQDIAQLLVSSWALASPSGQKRLLVSHGILDRALKSAVDEKIMPDWAASKLHFANTRVGLRCIELPEILEWAQLTELTSAPNPSYQYADIQVNSETARRLVQWLNVTPEQAERLGHRMVELIPTTASPRYTEANAG